MNRRQFTKRLAAFFATPAFPKGSAATFFYPSRATTTAMPAGAQFWANYLMKLHKTCTPKMLGNMLNIGETAALPLHGELVPRGVINSAGTVIRPAPRKKNAAEPDAHPRRLERGNVKEYMIQPAVLTDIEDLTRIWHDGWHEAHSAFVPAELTKQRIPESFSVRLHMHLENTLVIGLPDQPLGFCMLRGDEINQIYLAPNARGHGNADKLLRAGETRLARQGTKLANLCVIQENHRAIAFYRRNGWKGDSVVDFTLETLGEPLAIPCLEMKKQLPPQTI